MAMRGPLWEMGPGTPSLNATLWPVSQQLTSAHHTLLSSIKIFQKAPLEIPIIS